MRTLKSFVLILALAIGSFAFADTNPTLKKNEPSQITTTVGDLLKNPDFQLNQDVNALVELYVNKDNELVVLSVETKHKSLEKFIKNRLNYKKLDAGTKLSKSSFKIPVKLVKQAS